MDVLFQQLKNYKIFIWALLALALAMAGKWVLHQLGFEFIQQTSLHNSVVSSAIFVMGFVLSATIADYKESERIPAEFASNIQDIYNDAREIHRSYPDFDLAMLRDNLIQVLDSFRDGTRQNRHGARSEIADLQVTFGQMERAGVPPNFVVKLKQQQTGLLKNLFRVNYIQRIQFIPSAFFLIKSIVVLILALLLLTNLDPFYGGLIITGAITFIMTYMIILIHVISVPFQPKGHTRDDVSIFLLREVRDYLTGQDIPKYQPKKHSGTSK